MKNKGGNIIIFLLVITSLALSISAISASNNEDTMNEIEKLERKLSTLECESKGGKLNIYTLETDHFKAWGYYEGIDDYCEKDGLRYFWKNYQWENIESNRLK